MPFRDQPILLTSPLHRREDFFTALSEIEPGKYQQPTNLDGMADFLREVRASRIIVSDWRIDDEDTARITQVLTDLGIGLVR